MTLSFKRPGQAPGDATSEQLIALADLVDKYSAGEARVTHDQNVLLPWVHASACSSLWQEAKALGLASANVQLLTDMIACPGGDFCALANARSLPIAEAITQRYQDLDELDDIGEIDLHISGCINSCGHHHSGHIGILGVDKDGKEWYQVTLGGSDGSDLSGAAVAGKVIGPSFSAAEVPDVIEAVLAPTATCAKAARPSRTPCAAPAWTVQGIQRNPGRRRLRAFSKPCRQHRCSSLLRAIARANPPDQPRFDAPMKLIASEAALPPKSER